MALIPRFGRREVLKAACGAAASALLPACAKEGARRGRPISLGRPSDYPPGGTPERLLRVVVHRDESGLSAVSMVCTHQECLISPDGSGYVCPCHGSRFDRTGRVMNGPASVDLPWYRLFLSDSGELFLDRSVHVDSRWRLAVGGWAKAAPDGDG